MQALQPGGKGGSSRAGLGASPEHQRDLGAWPRRRGSPQPHPPASGPQRAPGSQAEAAHASSSEGPLLCQLNPVGPPALLLQDNCRTRVLPDPGAAGVCVYVCVLLTPPRGHTERTSRAQRKGLQSTRMWWHSGPPRGPHPIFSFIPQGGAVPRHSMKQLGVAHLQSSTRFLLPVSPVSQGLSQG